MSLHIVQGQMHVWPGEVSVQLCAQVHSDLVCLIPPLLLVPEQRQAHGRCSKCACWMIEGRRKCPQVCL